MSVKNIPLMAARTVFAASENEAKPAMRCVKLVFTSDNLKAVSYDGARLAAAKGDSKGEASVSMLIPAHSLQKLSRLVTNRDELRVGTTGKTVVFIKDNFLFSARLLEGEHIDADFLLESIESSFSVLTDATMLYEAVSSVSVVAGEYSAVSLRFSNGRTAVGCEGEGCSSSQGLEVVALSGSPDGEYWYNPEQLSQCLAALSGTLILEVGQNGILVMRTDDLVCLLSSRRKPVVMHQKEAKKQKKRPKRPHKEECIWQHRRSVAIAAA